MLIFCQVAFLTTQMLFNKIFLMMIISLRRKIKFKNQRGKIGSEKFK